jgi:myo-inositol-1-phosphate synthase
VLPVDLLQPVRRELIAAEEEIRPGYDTGMAGTAGTQQEAITALADDLADFRQRNGLASVVVINVASTEPPVVAHPAHASLAALRRALTDRHPDPVLPSSSVYAYAAFLAGCAYADFTPSTGARLPALDELARQTGSPYAGSDGKTGETLLKSVLAPMFASRALRVRSWSATNLLGGADGAALADPDRARSKIRSKRRVVDEALGYPVQGGVHIHHVPDLGEWKTAWDHVAFEGFLGVRMSLQFTWQGCDSALAAPLVLDLARLLAAARRAGQHGPVAELAYFFKDPVGAVGHDLAGQFAALRAWAGRLR